MTYTKGQEVASASYPVTRADLVRYAGASGDFNPIHWNREFAESVGLPGVIAHGMFTMALGSRLVSEWAGDPGRVLSCGTRFTRPVPVPVEGAATVDVSAVVGEVDEEAGTLRLDLKVTCEGAGVLGRARATVRL